MNDLAAIIRPLLMLAAVLGVGACSTQSSRTAEIETREGRRFEGRLIGDSASGFRFQVLPVGPSVAAIPLDQARAVHFASEASDPLRSAPPFHVFVGHHGRISGRLQEITSSEVRLDAGPDGRPLTIARPGVRAVTQRSGQAQVLWDGFETIDPRTWTASGHPTSIAEPRFEGAHALRLGAEGSSVFTRLSEPIGAGQFEFAFQVLGEGRGNGQQALAEAVFQGPAGPRTVAIGVGWGDDNYTVHLSEGPSRLAVQQLRRMPGWHRLVFRFNASGTDIAIDGAELAHGRELGGPLVQLRLVAEPTSNPNSAPAINDRALVVDDLRITRWVQPTRAVESDPSQDDVQLTTGDQLFGSVRSAGPNGISFGILDRQVALNWSDATAIRFRRCVTAAQPVEGLWVHLTWHDSPEWEVGDRFDEIEGVLLSASDQDISIRAPFLDELHVPCACLTDLTVLGKSWRLVLDDSAHHLGNAIDTDLDPPQPEGDVIELPFDLDALPPGPAFLTLDVKGAVGIAGDPEFSARVRQGELTTTASIDGRAFDTLNRHIIESNKAPMRIRLPIPSEVFQPGHHVLRFEQTGLKDDPRARDNLTISGVAIETSSGP